MFKTIARVYKSTFLHHADFTQCRKTHVLERGERISAKCRRHCQRNLAKSDLYLHRTQPHLLFSLPRQRQHIHQQTYRRSHTHTCRSPCLCPTWGGRFRHRVYTIQACTVRIVSSMSSEAHRKKFKDPLFCHRSAVASLPSLLFAPAYFALFAHLIIISALFELMPTTAGMGYQGPVYMGQSEWSPHHPSAAQAHSVMLQSQQHAVAGPATGYLHAVVNSGVLPPTMAAHLIRQASSGDPAAVAAAIATATPWVHAAQAAAAGSHTGGLVTAPAQSSALGPVVQQQQQPPYIRELHPPAQQQQMTTAPTSMVVAPPLGPVAPTAAASMPRPPEGLLLTAPLPPQSGVGPSSSLDHDEFSYELAKKRAKREANKRSAQQCRQRKKQAMQALHDQNQEYKRHHEVCKFAL